MPETYAPPRLPILELSGQLPILNDALPSDVEPAVKTLVDRWLSRWNAVLTSYCEDDKQLETSRLRQTSDLFFQHGFLKDHLALSSTLRCFSTPESIDTFLNARAKIAKPGKMTLWDQFGAPKLTRINDHLMWITAFLKFPIHGLSHGLSAEGTAMLVLAPSTEKSTSVERLEWKAWSLCTSIERFSDFPEFSLERMLAMPSPVDLSHSSASSYAKTLERQEKTVPLALDVLVMGGGQAGLSVAGHLKQLGIQRALVVERYAKAGGTWASRYEGLKLHTPKRYSCLPFIPVRAEDSEWMSAPQIASNFEEYVEKLRIPFWGSSRVDKAVWLPQESIWEIEVAILNPQQDARAADVEGFVTIHARQLVACIGTIAGSVPSLPGIPNEDSFKGKILHSSSFKSPKHFSPSATGPDAFPSQNAIVLGAATSGLDVAAGLIRSGVPNVTLIQRGAICLMDRDVLVGALGATHNENIPLDLSDRLLFQLPFHIQRLLCNNSIQPCVDLDLPRRTRLAELGFKTRPIYDMMNQVWDENGRHYINEATMELILDGRLKVNSTALPVSFEEEGVKMSDDSILPADLFVFATGYKVDDGATYIRQILDAQSAQAIIEVRGRDKEGEARGLYRDCGHPALLVSGGDTGFQRYYARLVAQQLLSRLQGGILAEPFVDETI
ncbi:hypothetical protein CBS101457_005423 [Exobasidium rhododendri]|nr:hypothetical protein CBS101457_005423 [Exobasidium rhododendri]